MRIFNKVSNLTGGLYLTAFVFGAAVVAPAYADDIKRKGHSRCNESTIKGTYQFTGRGTIDGKPYAEAGTQIFDGIDTLRGIFSGIGNIKFRMFFGTYSLNSNCTGIHTVDHVDGGPTLYLDFYTSPTGQSITYFSKGYEDGGGFTGIYTRHYNQGVTDHPVFRPKQTTQASRSLRASPAFAHKAGPLALKTSP